MSAVALVVHSSLLSRRARIAAVITRRRSRTLASRAGSRLPVASFHVFDWVCFVVSQLLLSKRDLRGTNLVAIAVPDRNLTVDAKASLDTWLVGEHSAGRTHEDAARRFRRPETSLGLLKQSQR